MKPEEYDYLLSLPLILHLPSEHTFIVHAGILPYDVHRSITAPGQPLAQLPTVPHHGSKPSIADMRTAQEVALLDKVKENNDPWVLLNMRTIQHNKEISKSTRRGAPWMGSWNSVMHRCAGYDEPEHEKDVLHDKWMPCLPSTVIYGHTASKGLDVHRWTVGLDSGCVSAFFRTPFTY